MPRISDIESSSSSDSDSDSDSSSVQSIPHNANTLSRQPPITSTSNQAEYATGVFVSRGSHVSGRLVDNRAKRKTEDGDDGIDGHASKTRRLRSSNQFAVAFGGDEPEDSDYDDDAPEDERFESESEPDVKTDVDSDVELVMSDVRPPQAQSKPNIPHLHPAFPKTAFQLLRQTLPYVHAKARDVPSKLRFIMNLPVKQVPVLRKTFNNSKAQNIPSYLIQATGELLSQQAACERCQRQNGVYHGCVVSRDPLVNQVFRGACAGCWYGRMGSKCTLRYTSENGPPDETSPFTFKPQRSAPIPAPIPAPPQATFTQPRSTPQARREPLEFASTGRKETPILPPVYHHTKPIIEDLRPANNSHTSPAQAQSVPRQPAAHMNLRHSHVPVPVPDGIVKQAMLRQERTKQEVQKQAAVVVESKLDSWTKRYDGMAMPDLLAAHKHLIEWNEDCNTRLAAMVNVLAKRCSESSQDQK